jgi:hypothetical protein
MVDGLNVSLSFQINYKAFAEAGVHIAEINVQDEPWTLTDSSLRSVLHHLLGYLHVPAVYLIRDYTIEVTTAKAVRAELGISDDRPLLPLVWEDIENVTLAKALQQLAKGSGMSIVLDPRALPDDSLKIRAGFFNVPVDSAVRILANMADLQMVQVDNVLYVTTPKRAEQMQTQTKKTLELLPPPKKTDL